MLADELLIDDDAPLGIGGCDLPLDPEAGASPDENDRDHHLGNVPCIYIPAGTFGDLSVRATSSGSRIAIGGYLINPQAALELIRLLADGIDLWRESLMEDAEEHAHDRG